MTNTKVYHWKCKGCGKIIESIYHGQFKFNKKIHQNTCGGNKRKDEKDKT